MGFDICSTNLYAIVEITKFGKVTKASVCLLTRLFFLFLSTIFFMSASCATIPRFGIKSVVRDFCSTFFSVVLFLTIFTLFEPKKKFISHPQSSLWRQGHDEEPQGYVDWRSLLILRRAPPKIQSSNPLHRNTKWKKKESNPRKRKQKRRPTGFFYRVSRVQQIFGFPSCAVVFCCA